MIITTVKLNDAVAGEIRRILCEYYDVEVKTQHTPDGEEIIVELILYPKGTLTIEKLIKRKRRRTQTDGRCRTSVLTYPLFCWLINEGR